MMPLFLCTPTRDLSHTAIKHLPTIGLEKVQNLTLEGVPSMKMFPSVLKFYKLKEARLSYAHHCCAFAHPEKQDEQEWKDFHNIAECQTTTYIATTPMTLPNTEAWGEQPVGESGWGQRTFLKPRAKRWQQATDLGNGMKDPYPGGVWHASTLNPNQSYTSIVKCGLGLVEGLKKVKCRPEPDAFNPCEDVMGIGWLRVTVWFVVICALLGNFVVLIITICSKYKLTVAKFLMCNLAFADLLLGVYLLLLASFDLHTIGIYFTYAISWQYDGGCQVAGFLAIFSTNLSVCTLTVITMERWYAISYAINLRKRLRMRQATMVMMGVWVYATIMAALPLVGVSSYSKTSICLPMEADKAVDRGYLWFLLISNTLAFVVICACYVDMYRQVRGNSCAEGRNDANIAKRMAVLVFTDFICLFPLAFFGVTAAAGFPLITVSDSKILLVFFFPLNSCCNPFLYAIFTKQFHKDLFAVLSNCGVCEKQAAKYRATFQSQPMSMSHTRNNTHANFQNFVHRPSDGSVLNTYLDQEGSKVSLNSPRMTPHHTPNHSLRPSPEASMVANGHTKSPATSNQSKDSRKLSVVPEASHISNEEMSAIQLELNLALDINHHQFKEDSSAKRGKGVRSVSQYGDVTSNPHKQNSVDSDRGSGCTNKYSANTSLSEVLSDSTDCSCPDMPLMGENHTEEKESSFVNYNTHDHNSAVLEPLLSNVGTIPEEQDSSTDHDLPDVETSEDNMCNDIEKDLIPTSPAKESSSSSTSPGGDILEHGYTHSSFSSLDSPPP
jgi:hypothetical protein